MMLTYGETLNTLRPRSLDVIERVDVPGGWGNEYTDPILVHAAFDTAGGWLIVKPPTEAHPYLRWEYHGGAGGSAKGIWITGDDLAQWIEANRDALGEHDDR